MSAGFNVEHSNEINSTPSKDKTPINRAYLGRSNQAYRIEKKISSNKPNKGIKIKLFPLDDPQVRINKSKTKAIKKKKIRLF